MHPATTCGYQECDGPLERSFACGPVHMVRFMGFGSQRLALTMPGRTSEDFTRIVLTPRLISIFPRNGCCGCQVPNNVT